MTTESVLNDLRYLRLLARSFPTIADASTEIINLEAILNLPKGTEHFLSDLHGEDQAFDHVLRNASGAVKRKVNEIFGNTLRESEKKELCTLIYYPEEKLELIKSQEPDLEDWYQVTLNQLVRVCRNVSSKYTRSKVRKALPREFSYIIQELLHESSVEPNKSAYVDRIIRTIISTGRADDFIIAMCNLIQRLTIDLLHIIGDIYDRGPGAHLIMDILCDYHNFDIQWGNHDVLWMGAASGNLVSIANVIRMCLRFGNMATLEDGYGINLLPLATFAMEMYGDDPCALFVPKTKFADNVMDEKTIRLIAQMHKAITVIQFKLEGEIIRRRPEFDMDDRMLLHRIDQKKGVVRIDGKEYRLKDTNWPTLDPKDPYRLSIEEEDLIHKISRSFESSEKMRKHMRCFFRHGSMYQVCNSNLLFHASVPMNPDGSFKTVRILGEDFKGRDLLDRVDTAVVVCYPDGRTEWMNKAARLMLDNRGVLPEEIISAIRNRQTVVHLPHTPVPTDLSVSVTEIYLKGKSQWLVSLKNIHTALEHTEMEAWRKLIRVLTHEIMNSITPIISLADTLSERSLTESSDGRARSQMRQGLQVIRRRSKGLLEFVENYRKLTRIAQPVRTDIKVRDFFNDLQQLFAGETALTFSCPDSLPHWKADRGQMEQVFINLIRNALEACRNTAGAHIEIGASISGKEWKFTVSDNGEGMLPEVTERIFVPFFTTKPGGSGIGLALCKQIVILHGGQISVDSRPDKGSRFTLSFPA